MFQDLTRGRATSDHQKAKKIQVKSIFRDQKVKKGLEKSSFRCRKAKKTQGIA